MSATFLFADKEVVVDANCLAKIVMYFLTIRDLIGDMVCNYIPLNCEGFPIKKDEFFSLLNMCTMLKIDESMRKMCDYLNCIIPIGIPREYMCSHAIQAGDLQLLQAAHKSGCELTYMLCKYACELDRVDCLKYMFDNGVRHIYKNVSLCDDAALCGSYRCLVMAHENGCKISDNTRANALYGDSLECLIYACEAGNSFSLCVSRTVCVRPKCIQYYFEHMVDEQSKNKLH